MECHKEKADSDVAGLLTLGVVLVSVGISG
jgi:hypothetical protein